MLKASDDLISSLVRTIYLESPLLNVSTMTRRRTFRLAGRLLLLIEINQTINDTRLSDLIAQAMPALKIRATQKKEASFELMKLARKVRRSPHFSDVKDAFLSSLNTLSDFEQYLMFKFRYSDELEATDEAFVEERLNELYPGKDLSSIEALDDYGHEFDEDFNDRDDGGWSNEVFDEEPQNELRPRDPNEVIADLFDSLDH